MKCRPTNYLNALQLPDINDVAMVTDAHWSAFFDGAAYPSNESIEFTDLFHQPALLETFVQRLLAYLRWRRKAIKHTVFIIFLC